MRTKAAEAQRAAARAGARQGLFLLVTLTMSSFGSLLVEQLIRLGNQVTVHTVQSSLLRAPCGAENGPLRFSRIPTGMLFNSAFMLPFLPNNIFKGQLALTRDQLQVEGPFM